MTGTGNDRTDVVPSAPGGGRRACADESKVHYGGQAVIEGVMMRGPERVATAVRLPNGSIAVDSQEYVSFSRRHRLLRLPVIRGGVTLIESLALGIKALNFSASVAMEAEKEGESPDSQGGAPAGDASTGASPDAPASDDSTDDGADAEPSGWRKNAALTGTMVFAFALGIVVFFWVPMMLSHWLTDTLGTDSGLLFNLIDGVIRVTFFIVYIWGISQWKEMRRVFEYHGAEHKTIFMQEAGEELSPSNARHHTTRHPRCGTSFLLIVMVVSILVFMTMGKPPTIGLRLVRLLLVPVIAGISYEVMKLSARQADKQWARIVSAPGVWLQGITTKEPSDDQVEVAIASLKAVRISPDDAREA